MRNLLLQGIFIFYSLSSFSQADFSSAFKKCNVEGSITIYDHQKQKWIFSDSADARITSLPASTFKIINLLIALETGVIKDENELFKWTGQKDTAIYGYRPEVYKDMTVKRAFEISAVWVFTDLAKRIGRERYQHYLNLCAYGNGNLSEEGTDFWNFGAFEISPANQIEFLRRMYEGKLPFSRRNISIVKNVMISKEHPNHSIRSKTGWSRQNGKDVGWWVGYVEREGNVYFFATRLTKDRKLANSNFGQCRKDITTDILRELGMIN